jgi:Histidine kinase
MRLFAGFGKRHILIALAFCVIVELGHLTYEWLSAEDLHPGIVGLWVLLYFVLAVAGLACAVATDNLLGERWSTGARLLLATVVTAVVGTLFIEALLISLPESLRVAIEGKEWSGFQGPLHRLLFRFSISAGWSMLLVSLYTMLEASRRATERLHGTRLAAIAAERQVVEADLRAMQARVEPDLLFSALVAVDEAYARSVDEGERALDALIAFLRAALPAESGSTSTVAAELDLLRAYLGVRELVSGPKLALDIAAEPATRTQPMPAMLLVPLARWALDGAPAAGLQVAARSAAGALEISLKSDLESSPRGSGSEIAGIRERLEHLYGKRARLEARDQGTARHALIALPA